MLVCSGAWALALTFSFERLISIDLVLYGGALLLEFLALLILRRREPEMKRPFRIAGGQPGLWFVTAGPVALVAFALWAARGERIAGLPALGFAALIAMTGPVLFWASARSRRSTTSV